MRPSCGSCTRFSLPCSLNVHSAEVDEKSVSASSSRSQDSPLCVPRRPRGRPRKDWTSVSETSSGTSSVHGASSSGSDARSCGVAQSCVDSEADTINFMDMELMHQFLTHTCVDLPCVPAKEDFWRANILRISKSHPFVLHLVLALSALHLSYLHPLSEDRSTYIAAGELHFQAGLRGSIATISKLDETEFQAMYLSAVISCLYTFAQGPMKDNFLPFRDTGSIAVWFPMLRGVRSIIEQAGPERLWAGEFAIKERIGWALDSAPKVSNNSNDRPRWEHPVAALRRYIGAGNVAEDISACSQALDSLALSFAAAYGTIEHSDPEKATDKFIFTWFYRLEDGYINCLCQKRPVALIVLGYAMVLLKEMDFLWFIEGWPEHILRDIRELLSVDERVWLTWPETHIIE